MKRFAVLQLSGCSGCEVALLNSEAWMDQFDLAYMNLVLSAYHLPDVDVLLVTGGVKTEADLYKLRRAVQKTRQVIAVGTCAISGGISNLGDRPEVHEIFLEDQSRSHLPDLLPTCRPIDTVVDVDLYLPGCPPTPDLYLAVLQISPDQKIAKTVCQECGLKKDRELRPEHLLGSQQGEVKPDICLINQGYLCLGMSTRGGCQAICTLGGYPCVGCRGPSDAFIERGSQAWFSSIQRVFERMTDIPAAEIQAALRSGHLSLFLFQFADYAGEGQASRHKDQVI